MVCVANVPSVAYFDLTAATTISRTTPRYVPLTLNTKRVRLVEAKAQQRNDMNRTKKEKKIRKRETDCKRDCSVWHLQFVYVDLRSLRTQQMWFQQSASPYAGNFATKL